MNQLQINLIEDLFSILDLLRSNNQKAINELQKPIKIKQIINREDLLYNIGVSKKDKDI